MKETHQDRKLKRLDVKPIFYYVNLLEHLVKKGQTPKCLTVCLLVDDAYKVLARGVSILSPLDQFNGKIGRAKALGMAVKAAFRKQSFYGIMATRFPSYHPIWKAWLDYSYRATYEPEHLTRLEETLVASLKLRIEGGESKCLKPQ